MSRISQVRRRAAWTLAVIALTVGSGRMLCQSPTAATANDKKARELLEDKKYSFQDVLHGNPEAVNRLKQVFALTSAPDEKRRDASVLLRVGVKDQVYFDYLASEAEKALENDIPWPTLYDKQGKSKALSPAFLKWCKRHHADPDETFQYVNYGVPSPFWDLAASGDPRGYDLLVKGIHSHNYMIELFAAKGLARLQDPRGAQEISAACRRVPPEVATGLAWSLAYFSDPASQQTAEQFIDDKKFLAAVREDVRKRGVTGLFPY